MKTIRSNSAPHCGYKEQLVTYLYGEASAAERAEFENHLRQCGECRDELQAFGVMRQELRAWEVPFRPPIEVTLPRGMRDILRELSSVIPGWLKLSSGLVAAAAVALVFFALAGTRLSIGPGGVSVEFGRQATAQTEGQVARQTTTSPAQTLQPPAAASMLTRAEAEEMITAAVARAQVQAKQEAQAQIASLEARLTAAHRAALTAATNKLRDEHRRNLSTLLAERQRPTINEWLFAANGNAEPSGVENEKNE